MDKKKLEDQIRIICYWLFGGVFWYLVVSFFLLSNYPIQDYIFDHQKAYDVLKDAFTLAAAFLAPVVALVLFSDWRVEHKIKSTFQLLVDLKDLSFEIKNGLGFYEAKIKLEKEIPTIEFRNREDRQVILWKIKELERKNTTFLIDTPEIKEFKDLQKQFKKLVDEALNDLHYCEYFDFENKKNEDSPLYNDDFENYSKFSLNFENKFNEIKEISNKIDLQVPVALNSIL